MVRSLFENGRANKETAGSHMDPVWQVPLSVGHRSVVGPSVREPWSATDRVRPGVLDEDASDLLDHDRMIHADVESMDDQFGGDALQVGARLGTIPSVPPGPGGHGGPR